MQGWLHYWRTVSDRVTWDRSLLRGCWIVPWLQWRLRRGRPKAQARIAYYPQPAGPWYTLPLALASTRFRPTRHLDRADVIMIFDDRTVSDVALPDTSVRLLNAAATDISKARVGRVFAQTFGYPLSVDPCHHVGPMVQKSDRNGVHDGCIVHGPLTHPNPDHVYQRLIESHIGDGVTEDLRCVCVGGEIVQVFRKEKDEQTRFQARYRQTTLHQPSAMFTPDERTSIRAFCHAIGLDFGSIDVLRDYSEAGRPYIVDVNKTCMPVLSMPASDLETALRTIGRAVEAYLLPPAKNKT